MRSLTANSGASPGITTFWNGSITSKSYVGERKIKFNSSGPQPRAVLLRVIGRLGGYQPHPMIEHFRFLKAHTRETAEDDDSVAVVAAFPLRPRRCAGVDLSGDG